MNLCAARREVSGYANKLLGDQCNLPEFRECLRKLLQIPGLVLSPQGGSGLVSGVLLAFNAVCPDRDWKDVVPGVVAGELFYTTFQLLDKVIDGEIPMGVENWDPETVCNAASVVQVMAYMALLGLRERGFAHEQVEQCIRRMSNACTRVAEAQHLDRLAERIESPTLELAFQITIGKSASIDQIIGGIGAGLGTEDPEIVRAFTEFGGALGIYSALTNDLNDVLPKNMHKADVRRRKKTLPIVYLVSQTSSESYVKEKQCLRSSRPISVEEEAMIRRALVESGAVDYTSVVAESYRRKARNALRSLEGRMDVSLLLSTMLRPCDGD
jgi:geranylgeranyl pyrophosphate synthase